MWDRLKSYLLSDGDEHLAFILAEYVLLDKFFILLGRELVLISDEDLDSGTRWDGLSLKLEALLRVLNRANQLKCTIVEVHSHPFSNHHVDFSPIDLQGQKEMVNYLSDVFPGSPYAALVLAQNAVKGQVWMSGKRNPIDLEEVRVGGAVLDRVYTGSERNPLSPRHAANPTIQKSYHRQVLALGEAGQMKIQNTRVGVIGLGGIGSIIVQQLAHLGVSDFLLVDDDLVETTNLHRLVTSGKDDIGQPKVEVAKRCIKKISSLATVETVCMSIRSLKALTAVKEYDVIFGCVDTDSGRLILNELCNAYLIPYIDCGVGINLNGEKIAEAGGRVIVWVPDRPCLQCANDINIRIATEELEGPKEREFRRRHGYVAGANVPEPAVISLNGTIASLAVTEFLALVSGFRLSQHYLYYDMLEQRVGPRVVKKEERCPACALQGLGDKADIQRYSRVGLPSDLPFV